MGGVLVDRQNKPFFNRDQIVSSTDIQRNWKKIVGPKLRHYDFLTMFSGSEPKAVLLTYERFEKLWAEAMEARELRLENEILSRALAAQKRSTPLSDLNSIMVKAKVTPADIEGEPDVDIE